MSDTIPTIANVRDALTDLHKMIERRYTAEDCRDGHYAEWVSRLQREKQELVREIAALRAAPDARLVAATLRAVEWRDARLGAERFVRTEYSEHMYQDAERAEKALLTYISENIADLRVALRDALRGEGGTDGQ